MQTGSAQLIARDLVQSFRMGARRIEVLRGISMEIGRNEAVFLSGLRVRVRQLCFIRWQDWNGRNRGASNSKGVSFMGVAQPAKRVCAIRKWALFSRVTS